jgi:pimeloyl-ACP methyl ester carboxylesterase
VLATPETRYARSGDIHIGYQIVDRGGPHDYVCLPPAISNIEVIWENPHAARFMNRLAGLGRYIHFDKRGQGLSDRDTGVPTIDERVDDVLAVMDAAGVERAVIAGASEGGSTAALLAALHPERVSHLVLYGSYASITRTERYPIGFPADLLDSFFSAWAASWGTPATLTLEMGCPTMKDGGEPFVRWLNRYERQSTSPGGLLAASRWIRKIDITEVLATIHVPTLVVHSRTDLLSPIEHGRYLAEHIPGATLVEVDGVDHLPWFGDQEQVLRAIETFVLGADADAEPDRALATVLFTDIVDSTRRAADEGDRAWRSILDDHDHVSRVEIERAGGRMIKSTGDGVLAVFERPGRAITASTAIAQTLGGIGVQVRSGIHIGEIEKRGDDVSGIAVNLAARVCGAAAAGEVLVTRTVTDLVAGSGFEFECRGARELKGVPGQWELHAVTTV